MFPQEIRHNTPFKIQLEIENTGYASTYNYRSAELVLQETTTKQTYRQQLDIDTRYWFTDELQIIETDFSWPETLTKGSYALFINFPDAAEAIANRPEYTIRLGSLSKGKSVYDSDTGWNLLFSGILVK